MQHENIVFLPALIGKLPRLKDIPGRFETIANNTLLKNPVPKILPYDVEFSLELVGAAGKKKLVLDATSPGANAGKLNLS